MSVSQILRNEVPANVNQERKTVNNSLLLYYLRGPHFLQTAIKKTPEICESYPQILNRERWEVSTQRLRKGFSYHLDLAVGIVIQPI